MHYLDLQIQRRELWDSAVVHCGPFPRPRDVVQFVHDLKSRMKLPEGQTLTSSGRDEESIAGLTIISPEEAIARFVN